MHVLCQDELYKTDGTTTYLQDVFDIEELREFGPMIEQIWVQYLCESGSTNFMAKVTLMWSVLGKTWSTSAHILPGHTLTFGHCAQAWIPAFHPGVTATHEGALPAASSVIPLGTLPGLGAITLPALAVPTPSVEPWAHVAIQIVRTLQDNFGLVVWLCNTADVTVSTS